MHELAAIAAPIIGILILVLVPLSVLRSLDEIKASQHRLEARLSALEARLAGRNEGM